jgi:hypothetical protein
MRQYAHHPDCRATMLRNAEGVTAVMQPHFTPAATSTTSGIAIDEGNVGQLAEVDAG